MSTNMNAPSIHHLPHAEPASKRHAELVRQTQKWVAQAFYGNLLKQMRNSPFRSSIMDGGRGGQMFEEMFDQQIADRMSRGAPSKLVNAIVQKIESGHAINQYLKHSKTGRKHTASPSLPGVHRLGANLTPNARWYVTATH